MSVELDVVTAGELLEQQLCSPQCLLAVKEPKQYCTCRCSGRYHGDLVEAELSRQAPLSDFADLIDRSGATPIRKLRGVELPDGQRVRVAGELREIAWHDIGQRHGAPVAHALLEDLTGSIRAYFFPHVYERVSGVLASGLVCCIEGKLDRYAQPRRLIVQDLAVLRHAPLSDALSSGAS